MSSASRMFLVLAILYHAVLHILAFSIAIPGNPVSNISFTVIWERDSTDPTVFALGQQLEDSPTAEFSGSGIFANISGTQGQSVDTQAVNLTVKDSGTFIIYGLYWQIPRDIVSIDPNVYNVYNFYTKLRGQYLYRLSLYFRGFPDGKLY
ncbi:hypothetical protein BDP27DRAFT_1361489 [Rhodocollybia butyracea]|uniref:Uncharacterized protein n=1 Tax=Rhodocollybia butyracea TaxID=206335 RepID=A0A9P5PT26_9AGAR|nr:hypothetical protein BDP27DRAFT_1361489 [Rhodocollybia butyracea]